MRTMPNILMYEKITQALQFTNYWRVLSWWHRFCTKLNTMEAAVNSKVTKKINLVLSLTSVR